MIALRLGNGRAVGQVCGNVARLFVGRRHWYRAVGGYSLDAEALRDAEMLGASVIEFQDRDEGRTFTLPLERFKAKAARLPDYGFGLKLCCPSTYYDRPEIAAGQLGLFTQEQGHGFAAM